MAYRQSSSAVLRLRAARTIEQMTVLMIALDVRYHVGFTSGWHFTG